MRGAAVVQHVGNVRQGMPVVQDQLLGLFYLVPDEEFLDRRAADLGEQAGEGSVILAQLLADMNGVFDGGEIFGIMHHLDDHMLDPFDQDGTLVVQEFEAIAPQFFIKFLQCCRAHVFGQVHLSQFQVFEFRAHFFQDRLDDHPAADTDHVFDVDPQDMRLCFFSGRLCDDGPYALFFIAALDDGRYHLELFVGMEVMHGMGRYDHAFSQAQRICLVIDGDLRFAIDDLYEGVEG